MPSEEAHEYPIFIEEKDLQLNPTRDSNNDSIIPPTLLGTGLGRGSLSTFRIAPTHFAANGSNSAWLSTIPTFPQSSKFGLPPLPKSFPSTNSPPLRRVKPSLRSPIPRSNNFSNLKPIEEFMDYTFDTIDIDKLDKKYNKNDSKYERPTRVTQSKSKNFYYNSNNVSPKKEKRRSRSRSPRRSRSRSRSPKKWVDNKSRLASPPRERASKWVSVQEPAESLSYQTEEKHQKEKPLSPEQKKSPKPSRSKSPKPYYDLSISTYYPSSIDDFSDSSSNSLSSPNYSPTSP